MSILINDRNSDANSSPSVVERANIEIRTDLLQHGVEEPVSASSPVEKPTPAATEEDRSESRSRVLDKVFRLADNYYKAGGLRQALEIYDMLVRDHSGTPQAEHAEERLFDIAHGYEQNGEFHLARSIYEQLL